MEFSAGMEDTILHTYKPHQDSVANKFAQFIISHKKILTTCFYTLVASCCWHMMRHWQWEHSNISIFAQLPEASLWANTFKLSLSCPSD